MIITLFGSLYETLISPNPNYSYEYETSVYRAVGVATVFISVLIPFVHYLVINRITTGWHRRSHWGISLSLNMAIIAFLTLFISKNGTGLPSFDGYMYIFALINSFLATIIFIICSFIFKRFSIHAINIPL